MTLLGSGTHLDVFVDEPRKLGLPSLNELTSFSSANHVFMKEGCRTKHAEMKRAAIGEDPEMDLFPIASAIKPIGNECLVFVPWHILEQEFGNSTHGYWVTERTHRYKQLVGGRADDFAHRYQHGFAWPYSKNVRDTGTTVFDMQREMWQFIRRIWSDEKCDDRLRHTGVGPLGSSSGAHRVPSADRCGNDSDKRGEGRDAGSDRRPKRCIMPVRTVQQMRRTNDGVAVGKSSNPYPWMHALLVVSADVEVCAFDRWDVSLPEVDEDVWVSCRPVLHVGSHATGDIKGPAHGLSHSVVVVRRDTLGDHWDDGSVHVHLQRDLRSAIVWVSQEAGHVVDMQRAGLNEVPLFHWNHTEVDNAAACDRSRDTKQCCAGLDAVRSGWACGSIFSTGRGERQANHLRTNTASTRQSEQKNDQLSHGQKSITAVASNAVSYISVGIEILYADQRSSGVIQAEGLRFNRYDIRRPARGVANSPGQHLREFVFTEIGMTFEGIWRQRAWFVAVIRSEPTVEILALHSLRGFGELFDCRVFNVNDGDVFGHAQQRSTALFSDLLVPCEFWLFSSLKVVFHRFLEEGLLDVVVIPKNYVVLEPSPEAIKALGHDKGFVRRVLGDVQLKLCAAPGGYVPVSFHLPILDLTNEGPEFVSRVFRFDPTYRSECKSAALVNDLKRHRGKQHHAITDEQHGFFGQPARQLLFGKRLLQEFGLPVSGSHLRTCGLSLPISSNSLAFGGFSRLEGGIGAHHQKEEAEHSRKNGEELLISTLLCVGPMGPTQFDSQTCDAREQDKHQSTNNEPAIRHAEKLSTHTRKTILTFTRVGRKVHQSGLKARAVLHDSVPTHAACASLLQTSDAHTGADSVSREARDRKSCAVMQLSKAFRSAPTNPSESGSGQIHDRSNAMATEPVREGVSALSLSINLPDPIPGDVFTYIASGPNAAIAIAAAMESADEQRLTELMAAFATSAEYQVLKQCYRADQRRVHAEDPVDAAEREEFLLDLAFSRMFLAGVRYAALPKEARRAA